MQPENPSFDTWTSGFLIAVAMGVFIFILLISTKNRKNLPIAFLVLSFSIILFQYVLFWTEYQQSFPYLVLIPTVCYYATGPLLYLYFLNLYKKKVQFNYALHFFPAILMIVPNIQLWLKYLGLMDIQSPILSIPYGYWVIAAHMVLYTVLIFLLIRKHRNLTSEYAKIRSKWATILGVLYAAFVLSYISYYSLVKFTFFNDVHDYMISIMMSISIYAIGYFIFKQPRVFNGEFWSHLFLKQQSDSQLTENTKEEFYTGLLQHIETNKPYLDNNLRLVQLADEVGLSTHTLSMIINDRSSKNFNQFINEFRLREAEKMLMEGSSNSIKSIYFDVGFNSKATFYKAFKNKYHCTPQQFKQQRVKGIELSE